MTTRELSRREFVQHSAAAAGGIAAGLGAARVAADEPDPAVAKTRSYNPDMDYRPLGKTGLWVSAVCLGGHYQIRTMMQGLSQPVVENRRQVVSRCLEHGINYVDACTEGEVLHYGAAMKGRREEFYIAFAMWPRCPRNAQYRKAEVLLKLLDEGLQKSGLEYIDLWRPVASVQGKHSEAEEQEMVKALETARHQGKCRFTGVSSHSRPWLKRLCETYPETFQVVLFPYTARSKEHPQDSLFTTVRERGVGTFGIKPFGGGSLFKAVKAKPEKQTEERSRLARLTLRYVMSNPAITAPIPGLWTPDHVDNAALAVKEGRQLAQTELEDLERATAAMWDHLPTEYAWLRDWEYV